VSQPPHEVSIDLRLLDEALDFVGPQSDHNHRLAYHLLSQLKRMGLLWLNTHQVILYHGESEAELDEAFAVHLDSLAANLSTEWPPEIEES